MDSAQILIVDSEHKMAYLLREMLVSAGFAVVVAEHGEHALQIVAEQKPDLMVLDLALRGEIDGREVVRRVRTFSEVPVVILTDPSAEADILEAFALGADEHVVRPFNTRIFLARLRALLKRCRGIGAPAGESKIVVRDLTIDLPRRRVLLAGDEIHLTEKEYYLLVELARHRDQLLLHEQLLTAVWGEPYRNEVHYLRSYIHVLRRKVEAHRSGPAIVNKSGVGYMLVSE
jgi:two-component system, OmpR family, KDP operon response regulator KdpE